MNLPEPLPEPERPPLARVCEEMVLAANPVRTRGAAALFAVLLALSACTDVNGPSAGDDPLSPQAAAQALEGARATAAGRLPPADSPARYVGRWAQSEAECETEVWRFEAGSAQSPRGGICRFTTVAPINGGYDVDAQCGRDGAETPRSFSLRFAESAQAMLIEGGPAFGDVGVVFCGPPDGGASSSGD